LLRQGLIAYEFSAKSIKFHKSLQTMNYSLTAVWILVKIGRFH